MPPVEEIYIVKNEEADSPLATKIGSVEKFDDYLSIPSSTNKYAVFFQAKDGWALLGGVSSDAFKNTRTVVQHVRHHVHPRIVPVDELAVMPHNVADAGCFDILDVAVF